MMYALYNVYIRYGKIHGGKSNEKEENFNVGMYHVHMRFVWLTVREMSPNFMKKELIY